MGICQASHLRLAVDKLNPPDAQQQRSAFLSLSNMSSSACTLEGYADVRPYDGSDQPIGVTLEHGSFGSVPIKDPGAGPVTLQGGDTA